MTLTLSAVIIQQLIYVLHKLLIESNPQTSEMEKENINKKAFDPGFLGLII